MMSRHVLSTRSARLNSKWPGHRSGFGLRNKSPSKILIGFVSRHRLSHSAKTGLSATVRTVIWDLKRKSQSRDSKRNCQWRNLRRNSQGEIWNKTISSKQGPPRHTLPNQRHDFSTYEAATKISSRSLSLCSYCF